ncbi:hypothetical protein AAFC00_007320 [Neodothiora populina]|uniref:Uncharacterized protein n=1 Tax=Neodothiora populina TaxID=2781224 RepID=A0ABR3PI55_9PEZI
MAGVYTSFLSSPSAAALAPDATLHYITTTVSIHEPAAIMKHIQAQEKLVKKKSETILSTIVSNSAIVVETATVYEFVRGGGALLPSMDDNFLVDSVVTIPMVHIVQLDAAGKIDQIRLYWDQGTMLRQVDAIGRTGRNWPIRDGSTMAKLVKDSVSSSKSGGASQAAARPSSKADEVTITSRPMSSKSRDGQDFHTRLFATGDDSERPSSGNSDSSVPTRTSAKPAPRQWAEIFPNGPPPDKVEGAKPKPLSPESRRSNPAKFDHFELGNGEDAAPIDPNRPPSAHAKKHQSTWDLEDMNTVPKFNPKSQPAMERHFGYGIDDDAPPTPATRPVVHAPRPDANPHFDMNDAPSPTVQRQLRETRPDALATHLKTERGVLTAEEKRPLGVNNNTSNVRRAADLSIHYTSTDADEGENDENDNRQTGRNTKSNSRLENDKSHWRIDETPEKVGKIYKTAGDGMGGRKDSSRSWMIGGDEPLAKEAKIYKTYGNGMGGRRDQAPSWSWGDRDDQVEDDSKDRKIYKTAGNGMGSRKAQELSHDHDDDDYADAGHSRFATSRHTSSRKVNELSSHATQEDF